jgi:hypothetical protein
VWLRQGAAVIWIDSPAIFWAVMVICSPSNCPARSGSWALWLPQSSQQAYRCIRIHPGSWLLLYRLPGGEFLNSFCAGQDEDRHRGGVIQVANHRSTVVGQLADSAFFISGFLWNHAEGALGSQLIPQWLMKSAYEAIITR